MNMVQVIPTLNAIVAGHEMVADSVVKISLTQADGAPFPAWMAGAHIDVHLPGNIERQYSLCGSPKNSGVLEFAVLLEPESRGGSLAIHDKVKAGDAIKISAPRNNFPLPDAQEYILIAGGIGITPLLPMIEEIEQAGRPWKLLYGGRSLSSMAFRNVLAVYGGKVEISPEDENGLLDISGWIGAAREGVAIMCCGPERLITAVEAHCETWPEGALNVERFRPADGALEGENHSFEVELARTGKTVTIPADKSIAETLEDMGIYIPRSCNEGTCGTCITKVLEGTPDHRDSFLRGRMREGNKRIMACCSRSQTPKLKLDV